MEWYHRILSRYKGLGRPYYQEHFSESPEELNLNICWIKKKYHELVDKGLINENESEPSPKYHQ